MPLPSVLDPATSRLHRLRRTCRRVVLRRRRVLAALAAAGAVVAGVAATAAPPPTEVSVLVTARDLPAGVRLEEADLTRVGFAPGSVPADALGAEAVGRTLAAPLRSGEPVTDVRLVGPDLVAADPGRVALPVRLPDAAMVALLRVGDRIDLVATDPAAPAAGGTGQVGGSQIVAYGVPVLALPAEGEGASVGSAAGGVQGGRLVVVGVDSGEVTEVADATVRAFVTFTWSDR